MRKMYLTHDSNPWQTFRKSSALPTDPTGSVKDINCIKIYYQKIQKSFFLTVHLHFTTKKLLVTMQPVQEAKQSWYHYLFIVIWYCHNDQHRSHNLHCCIACSTSSGRWWSILVVETWICICLTWWPLYVIQHAGTGDQIRDAAVEGSVLPPELTRQPASSCFLKIYLSKRHNVPEILMVTHK